MRAHIGYLTLLRIEKLGRLNRYIWETLKAHIVGDDVLEIGSGIGVYTDFLLGQDRRVTSIDIEPRAIKALNKRYGENNPRFTPILADAADNTLAEKIGKTFDSIICLNVLEHIEDDKTALANMSKLLRRDGKLVLLVPAYKFLYGTLDKNLAHYRRYSFREIREKLSEAGLRVEKHFHIHVAGIIGWFINSRVRKAPLLSKRDLKLYNSLLPLFRVLDRIFCGKVGQSMIIVASKSALSLKP
ncbi:MAG: class I SAM-dependent methyltransferase [Candidatus Omnitrophota bacterium]